MPNKQKVSAEKKVQIVREYLNERIGIAEAARRVGRDKETVKGWVNTSPTVLFVAETGCGSFPHGSALSICLWRLCLP